MVPLALVMGRDAAHVLIRCPDVRVGLQVGVRMMTNHMLLPPQKGGNPDLQARRHFATISHAHRVCKPPPHLYVGLDWLSAWPVVCCCLHEEGSPVCVPYLPSHDISASPSILRARTQRLQCCPGHSVPLMELCSLQFWFKD